MMVAYAHTDTPIHAHSEPTQTATGMKTALNATTTGAHTLLRQICVCRSRFHATQSLTRTHAPRVDIVQMRERRIICNLYRYISNVRTQPNIQMDIVCVCMAFAVILCVVFRWSTHTERCCEEVSFEGDSAILTRRCDHRRCAFVCSAVTAYAIPHTSPMNSWQRTLNDSLCVAQAVLF